MSHPILLYDGVCGLCNRLVQFILKRDRDAIFRFASLQSGFAADILAKHDINNSELDTFYVVIDHSGPGESLLVRSDAAVYVLDRLGGLKKVVASILRITPRFLRDWAYNVVARHRYRLFGRYDACPLPSAATRSRFLDQ